MKNATDKSTLTTSAAAVLKTVAKFDRKVWRSLLLPLAESMSTDENRHVINSTYFEGTGTALEMVSTDGRRLHRVTVDGCFPKAGFILSREDMLTFIKHALTGKALKLPALSLSVTEDGKTASFGGEDGSSFKFATVQGNYPNFRQVIPKGEIGQALCLNLARAGLDQFDAAVNEANEKAFALWKEKQGFDPSNVQHIALAESMKRKLKAGVKESLRRASNSICFAQVLGEKAAVRPLIFDVKLDAHGHVTSEVSRPWKPEFHLYVNKEYLSDLVEAVDVFSDQFGNDSIEFGQRGRDASNPLSLVISNPAFRFEAVLMPQRIS